MTITRTIAPSDKRRTPPKYTPPRRRSGIAFADVLARVRMQYADRQDAERDAQCIRCDASIGSYDSYNDTAYGAICALCDDTTEGDDQ